MNNEHTEEYVSRSTKDTYEAAYYLKYGARVTRVRTTPVPRSKVKKRGYYEQWTIHLESVPASRIVLWETGRAIEKVQEIATWRRRLKRDVKRYLRKAI